MIEHIRIFRVSAMGEAKRQQAGREAWLSALTPHERIIAETAENLYFGFVKRKRLAGACYHLSMFLKVFLEKERDVPASVVLGFVNDGTDDLFVSHGWLEHLRQKTDLALAYPAHPHVSRAGAVLILDHVVEPGWPSYQYVTSPPHDPFDPERFEHFRRALVESKRLEHAEIAAVLEGGTAAMTDYLAHAPEGTKYDQLAAAARQPWKSL